MHHYNEVSGTVLSNVTKGPLAGAKLRVPDLPGGAVSEVGSWWCELKSSIDPSMAA